VPQNIHQLWPTVPASHDGRKWSSVALSYFTCLLVHWLTSPQKNKLANQNSILSVTFVGIKKTIYWKKCLFSISTRLFRSMLVTDAGSPPEVSVKSFSYRLQMWVTSCVSFVHWTTDHDSLWQMNGRTHGRSTSWTDLNERLRLFGIGGRRRTTLLMDHWKY